MFACRRAINFNAFRGCCGCAYWRRHNYYCIHGVHPLSSSCFISLGYNCLGLGCHGDAGELHAHASAHQDKVAAAASARQGKVAATARLSFSAPRCPWLEGKRGAWVRCKSSARGVPCSKPNGLMNKITRNYGEVRRSVAMCFYFENAF